MHHSFPQSDAGLTSRFTKLIAAAGYLPPDRNPSFFSHCGTYFQLIGSRRWGIIKDRTFNESAGGLHSCVSQRMPLAIHFETPGSKGY